MFPILLKRFFFKFSSLPSKHIIRKYLFIYKNNVSLFPQTSFLRYCSVSDKSQNNAYFKNDPEVMEIINQLHEDFDEKLLPFTSISHDSNNANESILPRNILLKYQSYPEKDLSCVNLDQNIENAILEPEDQEIDEFEGLNLERGKRGVFDIEDLVSVLDSEKAMDICAIKTPEELNYADYLVLATGRSWRHILAVALFVRKLYKFKKHQEDRFVIIEGESSHDWIAMDMGNIVLHLFMPETRALFDLETLWTVGEGFEEEELTLLEKYSYVMTTDDVQKTRKKVTKC